MAKADKIYFDNLIEATEYSCKAADYLLECLENYNYDNLKEMLEQMHEYEHTGDTKRHDMTTMLIKAFVTPVDREDLASLSHYVDNITDRVEEVLQIFYMYGVKEIIPEAKVFAQKIVKCCDLTHNMIKEFPNFKKPEKLKKWIIELGHLEEECDALYIENTMKINETFQNPLDIISWREIYRKMENCIDACEHVGDNLDIIVMKNS